MSQLDRQPRPIEEIQNEIREATEAIKYNEEQERFFRSEATTARNRKENLMKELDQAIEVFKKSVN